MRSSTIHTLAKNILESDISLPLASSQDLVNEKITSRDSVIIYHYCDFSDPQSLEPIIILGTLIKQLLDTVAIPEVLIEQIERCFTPHTRQATPEELFEVLQGALPHFSKIYLLVDGLDECQRDDITLVMKLLGRLLQPKQESPSLKVILFSRYDDAISRSLNSYPRLEISLNKISSDINAFIEEAVRSKISCGDLEVSDESLETEIIATLKEGARGM